MKLRRWVEPRKELEDPEPEKDDPDADAQEPDAVAGHPVGSDDIHLIKENV